MQDNRILQQSLEKELALLEELTGLSLLKKDALLKDDMETLETIVLKEEALSARLKTINNVCLPQVQFFLRTQNDESVPNVLNSMQELVKEIRETAIKLQRHNELNQALIRDSLSVVQFTINALLPPETHKAKVYGASGKVLASTNRKKTYVFDSRR
jgi:flagellar biosynthesis/type III secretory pathway chaperone